jgi:hypothetical protein
MAAAIRLNEQHSCSPVHARLSMGIGASWRDHEQNGRCTKELL